MCGALGGEGRTNNGYSGAVYIHSWHALGPNQGILGPTHSWRIGKSSNLVLCSARDYYIQVNVSRLMDADGSDLCGGVDCGPKGSCSGGRCVCNRTANVIGEFCDMSCGSHGVSNGSACACLGNYTGLLCEFAPAYTVSGCSVASHCGTFVRTGSTCSGVPAYQRGGGVWRGSAVYDQFEHSRATASRRRGLLLFEGVGSSSSHRNTWN
eukprot:COSAG01_NODE_18148_length_1095_cov_1.882766_2_plen_208_part_01